MDLSLFAATVGPKMIGDMIFLGDTAPLWSFGEIMYYFMTMVFRESRLIAFWWKTKLILFHVVMFTVFLASKMWDRGRRLLLDVMFLVVYPAVPLSFIGLGFWSQS